ncbi:nucleoside-diphosphate-sugar epimerase [Sphaerochaeta pleomorpha str. Grapes]|uniref:Nucleoside-diphosphate-sugar epimerase n=1 Tax=Sphaerochaeta pleomorpha (strain ATCC BAA-1885 / DSM 22778 / Grapes) TaxID=158190 RepID=G8QVT3_SPHPG|nr:NAD-dependent epimerase/dehydratase family protein [Sphaerochaeta pleomorpha]AEV29375.1 nucleoside-diphosphate-sugar epimerase [Sphaerochaeta pleomorpha str. Grapes]
MPSFISTQEKADLASIAGYADLSRLSGKTILVTGATGLIGSAFIKAVVTYNRGPGQPITIIGLVRDKEKAKDLFGSFYDDPFLTFLRHDILTPLHLEVPVHFIVHAASITTSSLFVSHPVETIETTVLGSRNLLEFAKQQQVLAMVYLSSMEVYGRVEESEQRTTEKDLGSIDILNVRSSYSESKRLVECMCHSYYIEYGVPVTIARLAQTFGPGIGKQENRVFAQFARSALTGKDIVLHTTGQSVGNYCYLSDAIKAIVTLLFHGAPGDAYTIVNEETSMTIAEMASLVACSIANNTIKVIFDIPPQDKNLGYAPDTKLRLSSGKMNALGWHAEVNLEQAYQRLVASLREEKDFMQ